MVISDVKFFPIFFKEYRQKQDYRDLNLNFQNFRSDSRLTSQIKALNFSENISNQNFYQIKNGNWGHKNWGVTAFLRRRVMFKNRENLGRRSTWGLTACCKQTQQMKALTGEPLRFSRSVEEWENSGDSQHLGRRSFLEGLRNWGPAHLTCKFSICWGGTDLGTHAHWGATVPPFKIKEIKLTHLRLFCRDSTRCVKKVAKFASARSLTGYNL